MSIPEIPGMLLKINQSLKLFSERQLDGDDGGCLTTIPATDPVCPSSSELFEPIFPIWGKVNVIIWPAYEGSVTISW